MWPPARPVASCRRALSIASFNEVTGLSLSMRQRTFGFNPCCHKTVIALQVVRLSSTRSTAAWNCDRIVRNPIAYAHTVPAQFWEKNRNLPRALIDRVRRHKQVKESTSHLLPRRRCGKRSNFLWFRRWQHECLFVLSSASV